MIAWLKRAWGVDDKERRFDYLLAGSDAALLLPQEAVEDQPGAGVADLQAWEAKAGIAGTDTPVVLIGVSCGLSATYVGSMLGAALGRPSYTAVAVGFNPVAAVAAVKVDSWTTGSFFDVLAAMEGPHAHHAVVLNPVAGPETIAGSSRKNHDCKLPCNESFFIRLQA
jgi:N-acetylmuramic acid 6-phosphate (MurNAc-6-P) etherase